MPQHFTPGMIAVLSVVGLVLVVFAYHLGMYLVDEIREDRKRKSSYGAY